MRSQRSTYHPGHTSSPQVGGCPYCTYKVLFCTKQPTLTSYTQTHIKELTLWLEVTNICEVHQLAVHRHTDIYTFWWSRHRITDQGSETDREEGEGTGLDWIDRRVGKREEEGKE